MVMFLGAISAITGGIGAGLGYLGQRDANETNRQNMRDANAVTEAESKRNRDFQREMSNTSHQREVKDLEAAGLNPLLSATGGASTPGGASGSGTAGASMENAAGAGITSAKESIQVGLAMNRQKQELKNMKATEKLTKSQRKNVDVQAKVATKGIPQADIINKIYRYGDKALEHVKGRFLESPKNNYHEGKAKNYWEKRVHLRKASKQSIIRLPGRN